VKYLIAYLSVLKQYFTMRGLVVIQFFMLIILIVTFKESDAQDFVVTSRGDTIVGQVKPLMNGVDKKVQLVGEDKKKTVYPMFQVRGFRYKDDIYHPVKGPEGYVFMKLIKSGYLSLYNFQLPNQVSFDGAFLLLRDGQGMEVPNLSFKKYMRNFLKDCSEVAGKINNGELEKRELNQIIDEYNLCISNKTIDHTKIIAEQQVQGKAIPAWDILEEKVKSQPDFEGKPNALEMIAEVKGKIAKSEKIPNFLLEGLKSTLNQDIFKVELENALKEIN
jgi:hypothetical protein